MSATHLLVGNPTAQSGKNQERIAEARAYLERAGVACDFLATEPEGRTIGAVTRAIEAAPYRVVVYMGGDGTFREVASGILGSSRKDEVALGMLPTGTANDQGRSFGLAAGEGSLEPNLQVILAGHETRLDAGRMTAGEGSEQRSDWFFDSAGWGISARVLAERNKDREWVKSIPILRDVYRDQMVYAGALLRVFLESYAVSDKFSARVVADGVVHDLEGLTDLILKGTRIYGGAWVFDRGALHDDGKFEVVPFQGKRDWTSKAIVDLDGNPLDEDALNAIGVEHSKPFSAAKMEITIGTYPGGTPIHAQIDGEEHVIAGGTGQVTVEVVQRALRLIVPAPT
jgi:diacylglycerol kinase family enzyme